MKMNYLGMMIVTALASTSCGQSSSTSGLAANDGMRICAKVQSFVQNRYTGFNSIGIGADFVGNCKVSMTYEEGSDLLAFVDQAIASGRSPLRMDYNGKLVKLSHEVIGQIVAQAESVSNTIQNKITAPADIETCAELKDLFTKSLGADPYRTFTANGIGLSASITGQCEISIGFETRQGYRKFVASRVSKKQDPTSFTGQVKSGNVYRMHIDAFGIGRIVPQ